MELQKDLWVKGPFHIDFDSLGQLRIAGPGNHLYLGLPLKKELLTIKNVSLKRGDLWIKGLFNKKNITLPIPVVKDIRTVRQFTEKAYQSIPSFLELIQDFPEKFAPNKISLFSQEERKIIEFLKIYPEGWYGVEFIFLPETHISFSNQGFYLESNENIEFEVISKTHKKVRRKLKKVIFHYYINLSELEDRLNFAKDLLEKTSVEIEHLIAYDKTSGFEYGTIFPRDWMESADLGKGDLSQEVIDYMYKKALKFVTPKGWAWHEETIGEFASEVKRSQKIAIYRHIIDIEPRYILGLENVSSNFIEENKAKLRSIALFIVKEARNKDFIIFQKKTAKEKKIFPKEDFWDVGNWRDSENAFLNKPHPVAPYDVNCVFYPQALKIIKEFSGILDLKIEDLDNLISKWEMQKRRFEFLNPDGLKAFALGLYKIRKKKKMIEFEKLTTNHLDEAYDLVYGDPNQEEVVSFCKRLLSPNYFYTSSGPILVGNKDPYSSLDYHGKTIWPKQVAFVTKGLTLQLKKAIEENWGKENTKLIKKALKITCKNSLKAFSFLQGIPELYVDFKGKPIFYDAQEKIEGQMSKIQLWSAVGARRILRDYQNLL